MVYCSTFCPQHISFGIEPRFFSHFCYLSHGRACFKVLPRILCFNTMRYAFNMVTMMKEKVNTHFSFPLQLNMAPYTEDFLMGDQQDQGIETCNFVALIFVVLDVLVSKGWRSGESTCLPPMWPVFKSRRRRHIWVEFLVLFLAPRGFSPGTPVFPSSQKQTSPNSNSTRIR